MLVLAMVLTKKIANTMPSLLQRVFSTTVNYISQQLHNYIVRMVSAVKQLNESHSQPLSLPRLFLEGWPSSQLHMVCWFPCSALEFWPEGNATPCGALKVGVLREGGLRGTCHSFCLPHSEQPVNRVHLFCRAEKDAIVPLLPAVSSGSCADKTGVNHTLREGKPDLSSDGHISQMSWA